MHTAPHHESGLAGGHPEPPKHHEEVRVELVWGGTGESKQAEVRRHDTAGHVFELVFDRFHQKPSGEDTFEIDGREFPRTRFSETVQHLMEEFKKEQLVFEVIPPTSGA
jgi:hypothetical protein